MYSSLNEDVNKDYVTIKPHHFLDYIYDLAIGYRHEDESNINGSRNGELCRDFIDGKIKKNKFTPFVDDICRPCKKLVDGVRCIDYFDDETTLYYGFRYKNDFNYQLDLKLNAALPHIFCFDKVWDIYELLCALQSDLTGDIINLYKWARPERVLQTFKGLKIGLDIYEIT